MEVVEQSQEDRALDVGKEAETKGQSEWKCDAQAAAAKTLAIQRRANRRLQLHITSQSKRCPAAAKIH